MDFSREFEEARTDLQHASYESAERRVAAQRQILEKPGKGDPIWSWRFRLLDAEILVRQHRTADALALVAREDVQPPNSELAIRWRLVRSFIYWAMDRSEEATKELHVARQLADESHSSLIADVLHAEGNLIRDTGDLRGAMAKFKESLQGAQAGHDQLLIAQDLADIGFTSLLSGHYDEAMLQSEQAVEFARSIGARRELEVALGNAGWAYINLGDFEQALTHFEVAGTEAAAINHTAAQVRWLEDAAAASYELGRLDRARTYGERALQSASPLPEDVDNLTRMRTNLAMVLLDQGELPAAQQHLAIARAISQRSEDPDTRAYHAFVSALLADRQGDKPAARTGLEAALSVAEDLDLRSQIQDALGKSYGLDHPSPQADRWYRAAIQSFEQKRTSISDESSRLSVFGYGNRVYRDYAEFLIATGRAEQALTLLDESRARTLEEGLRASSAAPVRTHLDSAQTAASKLNTPVLFYALGPKASHLWAINGKRVQLISLPAQADIEALLNEHQRQISRSQDLLRDSNSAAHALYQMLVQPVQAMIPDGARVFIIPDGVLYGLNFETLVQPGPNGDRYWIENVAVTVSSSIGLLSHAQIRGEDGALKGKPLLLIGDPLAGSAEFQSLPNAESEITKVKEHFEATHLLVKAKAEATPAAYAASDPARYSYIHFVAHGTANLARPLDSAVVLSPAKADQSDFKLYAHEIVQHPLTADLVTISACYGAGSRSYAGEGLVGLAWAFLRAGAHNVVAALWQVDDASTPLLMGQFYDELSNGTSPDRALRDAKLSLLRQSGNYRKPFYWGTFQLYSGG